MPEAIEESQQTADMIAADAALQEAIDRKIHDRNWVRVLVPVVEAYWQLQKFHEDPDGEDWKGRTPPSPKVQKALDDMVVAAANRITRIVKRDLPMTATGKDKAS